MRTMLDLRKGVFLGLIFHCNEFQGKRCDLCKCIQSKFSKINFLRPQVNQPVLVLGGNMVPSEKLFTQLDREYTNRSLIII